MRRILLTGLLVLIPAYFTFYVLRAVVSGFDHLFLELPVAWQPPAAWHFPGLGLLATVALVFAVGLLARNFFGAFVLRFFERAVGRIPVINSIYSLFRQVAEVLFGEKAVGFKRVVMVQWPRTGVWTLALVASELNGHLRDVVVAGSAPASQKYLNLFVPTTPNPTSGFYFIAPESDVRPVNITVEQALKTIISAGAIPPIEAN